mmetsp:Transcript_25491/g.82160  ORF Transcript_25491/g.82160 Transcript_25491/m.82160 type:complete len:214 (+) Transcript_25491:359-1000(+)
MRPTWKRRMPPSKSAMEAISAPASAVQPKLHCFVCGLLQFTLVAFQQVGVPSGYCMLLWPLQTHTSPKRTSLRRRVRPPDRASRLCFSKLAPVAGRSARHVVDAPVAWSGATVARIVCPRNTTSTEAPASQKPHTTACFGAAARTIPLPTAAANRKAAVAAPEETGGAGSQSCMSVVVTAGGATVVTAGAAESSRRSSVGGMPWLSATDDTDA